MFDKVTIHIILGYLIAAVWIINGLFCKVLNLVPRHEKIVSIILGAQYAGFFTKLIGFAEIIMAIWILSNYLSSWCALAQIIIVVVMNVIEFMLAPDLLLFGRKNAFFALLFVAVVFLNEFILKKL
jgi:hypothetical protein